MMFTVSDYLEILTHVTLDYTYVSDWRCRDIHVNLTVLTYDYVLHNLHFTNVLVWGADVHLLSRSLHPVTPHCAPYTLI